MAKVIEMKGKRYGRLKVIKFSHKSHRNQAHWLCECDCGELLTVHGYNLRSGHTKSCGCIKKDNLHKKTHGMSGTPTYLSWLSMRIRCLDENYREYHYYGGRGISMQESWSTFEGFLKDMGERPDTNHSLDRLDPNKDYCKENCRWATIGEQARNKRKHTNNTSGVTGVYEDFRNGELDRYKAEWRDLNGKTKSKSFSINKYGKEEAFRLACEARENAIKELNEQGAGYSENHGK